jgi:hypothetical protein
MDRKEHALDGGFKTIAAEIPLFVFRNQQQTKS